MADIDHRTYAVLVGAPFLDEISWIALRISLSQSLHGSKQRRHGCAHWFYLGPRLRVLYVPFCFRAQSQLLA
jgi:hypothetical protein